MKLTQLALVSALLIGTTSFAAVTKAKEKSIRELFALQKTERIVEQVTGQIVEQLSQEVPADKQKKLGDTAKSQAKGSELIDALIPIYDQNLSQEEVDAIIAFYKTPAGQKYIAVQPKLIGESTAQIQKWAGAFHARVKDKMGLKK